MFKDMHQQDSLELLCVLLDSVRTEEIGELVLRPRPLRACTASRVLCAAGMSQSCQLKRVPNFIDDVFGGLTRSVVVCSRCCRPSVALERCMHTSVCFPAQLVDSLRPQRSAAKNKNKGKGQANQQGGKFKKGGKNNNKGNQAQAEDELSSPRASGGRGSPETTPPPASGKKKQLNIKQQQREWQKQKKANKGKGGFTNFELLDENAEEERRQAALEAQKVKEEALSEASSAHVRDGGGSDDAASRGSVADAAELDGDDEAPFMDLFEESEEQLAVSARVLAAARLVCNFGRRRRSGAGCRRWRSTQPGSAASMLLRSGWRRSPSTRRRRKRPF